MLSLDELSFQISENSNVCLEQKRASEFRINTER